MRRVRANEQAANNLLGTELANVPATPYTTPLTATPAKIEVTTTAAATAAAPPLEEKRDDGPPENNNSNINNNSTSDPSTATPNKSLGSSIPMAEPLAPAVAAALALFSTMDGEATDRKIKATLYNAAGQVMGGTLVLDKATVIAEGGAARARLMEMGREWPNSEFGALLGAIVDAE